MDLKGAAMAVLISLLWSANTVIIKTGLEGRCCCAERACASPSAAS
jgi:hypothetical protein